MPYVLIIHDVADYAAWKVIFDEARAIRKAAGEQSYSLFRSDSDANRVVHFSRWQALDAARAFFESAALVAIRARAGVHAPHFLYLDRIEQADL